MPLTKPRVSVAEFLAMPEEKPYLELVDGEVLPKTMPGASHSAIVTEVIFLLMSHARSVGGLRVGTELRHMDGEHEWVFLPDVSVTPTSRLGTPPAETRGPVEVMPDLAIEVLSPDDKPGRISQRIAYYLRAGVRLLWIIDPETELVTVWEAGALPRIVEAPEALDGSPVLPGFALDLAALFGRLHQHRP